MRLADLLLATLLAPPCAVCARVLPRPTAGAVCDACWLAIRRITPPVCDGCGAALPSRAAGDAYSGRCPICAVTGSAVDRARALGAHEGALRDIVHALKYGGRRSIVPRLAAQMRVAGADVMHGVDALVPVPLHPRRRRARGFNQARLLAEALGGPVWDILARTRDTRPQVDLTADERRRNVEGAFDLRGARRIRWRRGTIDPHVVSGARLLLVDDVTTTGATLDACARVLKAAGAREVRALTAARVDAARLRESPR